MPSEHQELIDREAVQAVVNRSTAILDEPELSPMVQDAIARFDIELSRQHLRLLKLAALQVLKVADVVATFRSRLSANPDWDELETVTSRLLEALHDQYGRVSSMQETSRNAEVRIMARSILQAQEPLHLEVSAILEEVRERAADADIDAGRIKRFGSAKAAIAYLRRKAG